MRNWNQLAGSARRIDAELRVEQDSAELVDVEARESLVLIKVGDSMEDSDRDRVLRAAIWGAITEIRRRGA